MSLLLVRVRCSVGIRHDFSKILPQLKCHTRSDTSLLLCLDVSIGTMSHDFNKISLFI